jgi:subtilisin family serine protease
MNEVIAVGGMKPSDGKWLYSCWGNALDVSAITGDMCYQGDIYTMDQEADAGFNPFITGALGDIPDGYWTRLFGGTSAAAPQVAGIAALILARRPDLASVLTPQCGDSGIADIYATGRTALDDDCPDSVHIVRQIITKTATRRLNGTWNPLYGYGRVNAFYALLAVMHGDLNNDLSYDPTDLGDLIDQLFFSGTPFHPSLGDLNCDGAVDQADLTYMIDFLFTNGPHPPVCLKYPAP